MSSRIDTILRIIPYNWHRLVHEGHLPAPGTLSCVVLSRDDATMTNPLDLDAVENWHPDFAALVYARNIWPQIEAKLDAAELSDPGFLPEITCDGRYLQDQLARFLRREARAIQFSRYSHVVGYHGCRILDPTAYRSRGIVPSNTSELISRARVLFAGIPGFDAALESIGASYLEHNEGKVGLLLSCIRAKHSRNAYTGGSELISGLANRLGAEAKSRFAQAGTRTLIKCAIPMDWLDKHTTFPVSGAYCNHVLEQLIIRRRWPEDEYIGIDGGYMLTRVVPPENILEFIDMTEFGDDDR